MMDLLVSIIIPCYNQARFLPSAIESALNQTYSKLEVVVVNDGSPDNTDEVAASYPRVRCIRQANAGLADARNAGFAASRGELVCFLDADDQLTSNALESHLTCFTKHPDAGFVVGDINHISMDGSYAGAPRWPLLGTDQYEELLRVNHVANTIAVMFRRRVLERLGGFDPSCSPAEDYDLLLRAARLFPSAHHRTVVAHYRRHSASLSRQGSIMLGAMNRVMRLQREQVKNDPKLMAAWREGDGYWRDHFGIVAIKELFGCLVRGRLRRATVAAGALLRFGRGRLLFLPYRYRRRFLNLIRRERRVSGAVVPAPRVSPAAHQR